MPFGTTNSVFNLESLANTDAGTYTTQVEVSLLNYPTIKKQATATMTVTESVVATV